MVLLDGHSLALADIAAIADAKPEGDEAVYGINTGFGPFAELRTPHDALCALQLNLLRRPAKQ